MIPRTLQIKNFLSYGSDIQTIDFSHYPLICLSGKNGHGKSALLDAITWALWGQARKVSDVSKADEGLLRLGQTQMMVILDFEFNNQMYRVRREFAKTYGKPYAVLEFGMLDTQTDTLHPLTEKTIRATQAKIEGMLNLDIDSFVNSAFLRQGQSNEFSKKSAKERKEILATILGINRYETVRKLALEKIKTAQATKTALAAVQTNLEREVAHKIAIMQQLTHTQTTLDTIAQHENTLTDTTTRLECAHKKLQEDHKQQALLTQQRAHLEQEQTQLRNALRTLRTQWRSFHATTLRYTDHAQLQERKVKLMEAISGHQQALQNTLELKEQILRTKEQIQHIEKQITDTHVATVQIQQVTVERLRLEIAALEHQRTELTTTQTALLEQEKKLAALCNELEKQAAHAHTIKAALISVERQFEKRKDYYQKFITQGNWLTNELQSFEHKQAAIHDTDNPSCPLCEQNLSASRKKFLKGMFGKQEHTIKHQLNRLTTVIKNLKTLLIEQHDEINKRKQDVETSTKALIQLEQIRIQQTTLATQKQVLTDKLVQLDLDYVTKLAEHAQAVELLEKKSSEQTQILHHHAKYQTACTSLNTLQEALTRIAYNAGEHQKITQEFNQLETMLMQYAQLREQLPLQTERVHRINELCVQLKKIAQEQATLTTTLAQYTHISHTAQELANQHTALMTEQTQLRTQKETCLQEKGRLENQHKQIEAYEREHVNNQTQITQLTATMDDYHAIATATGKDGIQALLIEDAIPEIEQEANTLLAKLTHNQAHLLIESLRDLKKGGARETLDIKISDAAGVRPYEMFSGGEAFRIDFALRIAISKLLARRAGTSLQTLIIDEGFGSQDDEGLSHIMDAIHLIQDDFAKIIIVSHLPAMKDQFPVHFVVNKGPQGSVVQVFEQG
ncbi:MAG: AAA family ATPase [Candidatus Babeliales bacterium]